MPEGAIGECRAARCGTRRLVRVKAGRLCLRARSSILVKLPPDSLAMYHVARITGIVGALPICVPLFALGVNALPSRETAPGLRDVPSEGADVAVGQLGESNGCMDDPQPRIPLPFALRSTERTMRAPGMRKQADERIETMHRAWKRRWSRLG